MLFGAIHQDVIMHLHEQTTPPAFVRNRSNRGKLGVYPNRCTCKHRMEKGGWAALAALHGAGRLTFDDSQVGRRGLEGMEALV